MQNMLTATIFGKNCYMELGLPNQGRFRSVKPLDGDELAAVEARLAQEQADADLEAAKLQLIQDYLPSWSQVETIVDNISTLAEAKAFLKKLARINYLFIKERTE